MGRDGVVTIEDNYNRATMEIIKIEGMQFDEGMLSPFFVTDAEKLTAHYEKPKILMIDGEVVDILPLAPLIEECVGKQKQPLLIIAHNITGTALQTLAMSKAKNGVPVLACKAPQHGEYRTNMLEDMALLTGCTIMGGTLGIQAKDMTYDCLGTCESVLADRSSTTIVGGGGDKKKINGRIKLIEEQMEASVSDYDKEKLQERLAKLTSGVAIIRVGAHSELEQKEIKMRVEDSLHATKAAMEDGIVPGGGLVYLNASRIALKEPVGGLESTMSQEEVIGRSIVKKALRTPLLQIASNSGLVGEEIIAGMSNGNGYNFLTNKYEDLVKSGVIDPVKVVKNALKNAASVASMMLTCEVCIYESDEDVVPASRTPKPTSE